MKGSASKRMTPYPANSWNLAGERYYAIRNVDKMEPFFISVISDVDHWLFVSSTGGLNGGPRFSRNRAVSRTSRSTRSTRALHIPAARPCCGSHTNGKRHHWEPFNREHDGRYAISRNLYKNILGNKLCFEEINHDLQLAFRYTWVTSDSSVSSDNASCRTWQRSTSASISSTDCKTFCRPARRAFAQTNTSNLVDAYKWTELDEATGLAFFTLYSGITDRAEPCESLKAKYRFLPWPRRPQSPDLVGSSSRIFAGAWQLSRKPQARHARCVPRQYVARAGAAVVAALADRRERRAKSGRGRCVTKAARQSCRSHEAIAQSIDTGSEEAGTYHGRVRTAPGDGRRKRLRAPLCERAFQRPARRHLR